MNFPIGKRWEEFIEKAVENGHYGSASEVVQDGLRLVEEREAKLRYYVGVITRSSDVRATTAIINR